MAKFSNLLNTNETFRRDLLVGLGIWLCLLVITFAVLPAFGLAQMGDRRDVWLLATILLGLAGVFILALCPQYIERDRQRQNRWARFFRITFWRLLAWLGLAGLAFPLLIMSYEVFLALFSNLVGTV